MRLLLQAPQLRWSEFLKKIGAQISARLERLAQAALGHGGNIAGQPPLEIIPFQALLAAAFGHQIENIGSQGALATHGSLHRQMAPEFMIVLVNNCT